jgi:hypothetical protein
VSENAFRDKALQPTPALLGECLGPRAKYLDELKHHVPEPLVEQWKYYGKTILEDMLALVAIWIAAWVFARD